MGSCRNSVLAVLAVAAVAVVTAVALGVLVAVRVLVGVVAMAMAGGLVALVRGIAASQQRAAGSTKRALPRPVRVQASEGVSVSECVRVDGDKESRLRQHLPRTAEWMQARPHARVRQAAAANVAEAREAARLVRRVDARMAAHEAAATELAGLVSQLGRMTDEMDAAGRLARSPPPPPLAPPAFPAFLQSDRRCGAESMQNQLVELEAMVADAGRRELDELHRAEQARFDAHAEQRRAELDRSRRAYARQLGAFERERVAMLAAAGPSAAGRARHRAVAGDAGALEAVSLDDGRAEGLDDFFGSGDGEPAGELPAPSVAEELPVQLAVRGLPAEPQPQVGRRTPEGMARPKTAAAAVLADEDIDDGDDDELLRFYGR